MRGKKLSQPDLWLPDAVETTLREREIQWVAGVDEAGRGPLAGPVVAAAVVLPMDLRLPEVNDSKKLTEARRETLYDCIMEAAMAMQVSIIGPHIIDEINILRASQRAMREAVMGLSIAPQIVLLDGLPVPDFPIDSIAIVGGDASSLPIAAASIIAKVTRDRLMRELHETYPNYNFHRHKGYSTADHLNQLREHGPCPAHRQSFAPVRACVSSSRGGTA